MCTRCAKPCRPCTSTASCSAGSSSSSARRGLSTRSRWARRCAAASHSSVPPEPGRCSSTGPMSFPRTSNASSHPCCCTGSSSGPRFWPRRAGSAGARPSSAHGEDEFIVREYLAEEAPRVVVLSDRRPAMALFPRPLPWLDKPEAMRQAGELIAEATLAARGFFGYLDFGGDEAAWVVPRTHHELPEEALGDSFRAPEDNVALAFDFLAQLQPPLPSGTFRFILSDFLMSLSEDKWISELERRWDVVPVVIQDPVWERSFPDVGGVVVPLHDQSTG